MARMLRTDWQGALHHVMARGIDGNPVFLAETDKEDLISRLDKLVPDNHMSVYAWSIMPNHLHLMARTGSIPLWKFMHRLLTGYAISYNRRNERHGHVFQGRFRSILVQDELYFSSLLRYIHRNPLKAQLVRDLESLKYYPWCGHGAILGVLSYDWQDTEHVISRLRDGEQSGSKRYSEIVKEECGDNVTKLLQNGSFVIGRHGIHEAIEDSSDWSSCFRVIGSRSFALETLERIRIEQSGEVRNRADTHHRIEELFERVHRLMGVNRQMIRGISRSPAVSDARAVISWACNMRMGLSMRDCMHLLGMSRSGISKAIARGDRIIEESKFIRENVIG